MTKTGLDRIFEYKRINLKNKRIGLLAHPASINSHFRHATNIFLHKNDIELVRLFGPEHGLWGTEQDMAPVDSLPDAQTDLPVKSLYGKTVESLKPTVEDLKDLDVLICDLQDIGSRFYTFIYTMALCMKACAENNIEMVVLDRPNPINGLDIEGKILQKGFESFVGLYRIPIRHGMTIGELALYFNSEEKIDCRLNVVHMTGWKRKFYFDETGLPWVLPSPNMPTVNTALVYPGMCLLEATNISEGRGTTRPFELVGAPFISADTFSDKLNKLELGGVFFRPTTFKPHFQKWVGQNCHGVQIHVTNRKKFRPVFTGIAVLKTIMELYPNDFAWRDKPYEFVTDIPAIDLLSGDNELRNQLEKHLPLHAIQKNRKTGYAEFLKKRNKYLLYEF